MLAPHQEEWTQNAKRTIQALKRLLEPVAVDIQHIGSTAIPSIHAKPIIDLVVGVRNLGDILPYVELLKQHDIVFRGEDVAGQLLFVMGDFEKDTRTHCQRRFDFVIFRRTGNVRKWRVKVSSL